MIAFIFTVLLLIATIGGLFTFFEICILKLFFKIENLKYIKLLKFLEFFYVILTIISTDFYLYIRPKVFSYLIYSLLITIYFGILIYDFWKKKITKKDFIIYFLYFFIDIVLIYLIMVLILSNFPSV